MEEYVKISLNKYNNFVNQKSDFEKNTSKYKQETDIMIEVILALITTIKSEDLHTCLEKCGIELKYSTNYATFTWGRGKILNLNDSKKY